MTADLTRAFVRAVERRAVEVRSDLGASTGGLAADAALLGGLLANRRHARAVRIWDNANSLIVSPRLARLPRFAEAARSAVRAGWQVQVRSSGGTTVIHRRGVINVSLVDVDDRTLGIADGFDTLCALIGEAAASLGIRLEAGRSRRGYCAGSHDLLWRGRKVAGTAAQVRRHGRWHGRLVHAATVVTGDPTRDLQRITSFERALGLSPDYDPAAHATLEIALASSMPSSDWRSCLGEQPNFTL